MAPKKALQSAWKVEMATLLIYFPSKNQKRPRRAGQQVPFEGRRLEVRGLTLEEVKLIMLFSEYLMEHFEGLNGIAITYLREGQGQT